MAHLVQVGSILRYPKPLRPADPYLDGLVNFGHATRDPRTGSKMALLESGINAFANVRAEDGSRRPAILLRSSPAKAGTEWTPWEDVVDLANGTMTYFGDHKVSTRGPLGSTKGNRALEEALPFYLPGGSRVAAPPLLVFLTTPWLDFDGAVRDKGAVRFLGPAVLEQMTAVEAIDPVNGQPYPNYRTLLRLTEWSHSPGAVDWRWINDRKDPSLTSYEAARYEPDSWHAWRTGGRA